MERQILYRWQSFYPVPTSSMELADVEVIKPPTAARIDPAIEVSGDEGVGAQISSCEAENSAE